MGIEGDGERIAIIRQGLAAGERIAAASFAAGIANRARTDEARRDDADTLAELVRVLADALIAIGDSHAKRGRPAKSKPSLAVLAEALGPVEYERRVTAAEVADGRDVAPRDAAGLLWWAYIGPEWQRRHDAGEAMAKSPAGVLAFLQSVLADPGHEHHKHYSEMLPVVAHAVLREDGFDAADVHGFKADIRGHVVAEFERLGLTDANLRRALTGRRRDPAR